MNRVWRDFDDLVVKRMVFSESNFVFGIARRMFFRSQMWLLRMPKPFFEVFKRHRRIECFLRREFAKEPDFQTLLLFLALPDEHFIVSKYDSGIAGLCSPNVS